MVQADTNKEPDPVELLKLYKIKIWYFTHRNRDLSWTPSKEALLPTKCDSSAKCYQNNTDSPTHLPISGANVLQSIACFATNSTA